LNQPLQSCDRKPSHLNTSVSSLGLSGRRLDSGDVTRGMHSAGQGCPRRCLLGQTGTTRRFVPGVSHCIDALSDCQALRSQRLMPRSCVAGVWFWPSYGKQVGLRKMSAGRQQPRERNFLPFTKLSPTAQGSVLDLSGMHSTGRRDSLDSLLPHAALACPLPHSMLVSFGSAVSLIPRNVHGTAHNRSAQASVLHSLTSQFEPV
jgi:hypothetical protein